ncbi:MAG: hypothetical protein ACRC7C_15520 [Beijerinckiaceae bacterium]
MFNLARPLGRLGFLLWLTPVNTLLVLVVSFALLLHPTGAGHIATLIVVAALFSAWFTLHARRFADAGKGAGAAGLMAVVAFASFAIGHLIMAALWAAPEVKAEAFRTGGGFGGGGIADHVETLPFLIDGGKAIAATLGIAGSLALSGAVVVALGLVSCAGAAFSIYALLLSGGRSVPRSFPPTVGFSFPRRPGSL